MWGSWLAGLAPACAATDHGDFLIRAWETDDGLPENSATTITRTPDGYLWFGTFSGLVRFNGAEFKVFTPANTPGLPSGGIVNLHLDRRGRLWISTYLGLVVKEGDVWRSVPIPDSFPGGFIRTFTERSNGDLLLTTFGGRVIECVADQIRPLPTPLGNPGQGYFGQVDEEGHWWVVQSGFIGRWEDGSWVSRVRVEDLQSEQVGCGTARGGGFWLIIGNTLRRMQHGVETARRRLPQPMSGFWSLTEDRLGSIWIATYNRGFRRLLPDDTLEPWTAADGVSDQGRCVFEDGEGNLWLGTSGDGLLRLTPRRFHHFEIVPGRKGLLVQSLVPDATGGVWAATFGLGLRHLDDQGATPVLLAAPTNGFAYLQSVWANRSGRLWLGALGFEPRAWKDGGRQQLALPEIGVSNVIALFQDSRERLWLSSGYRTVYIDGSTNQDHIPDPSVAQGLPPATSIHLAEDQEGRIWAGSERGLFRTANGGSSFLRVEDEAGHTITNITCLAPDPAAGMWIATSDHGLWIWQADRLRSVPTDAGFALTNIGGLVTDGRGYLWLTSGRNVLRARIDQLHAVVSGAATRFSVQLFDESDGLPRAEFTAGRQPRIATDRRGRLWFATRRGATMVDPARLRLNEQPPPVFIERLVYTLPGEVDSVETLPGTPRSERRIELLPPFPETLELPAGCRHIAIHYAGLSLTVPEKVRYETRLRGTEEAWRPEQNRHVAEFHELGPRRYVFQVRAANNDGVWNEAGASVVFSVRPYVWQTGWFRSLAAAFLVLLGAILVRAYHHGRMQRAVEQEQAARQIRDLAGRLIHAQEAERRRLARELHDDFTQRLARLAIDAGQLEKQASHPETAGALRELREGLVGMSGDVHGLAYRLHPAVLEDLGLEVALRSETDRFIRQEGIPIALKVAGIPENLGMEASLCCFRVTQEALRNARRHAQARHIEVSIRPVERGVELVIQDDGRGFDPAAVRARPSLGLESMRERVYALGGELEIESRPGHGTTILAWIPVAPGAQQSKPESSA